jgi:cystathionine beta-lyase family protein involved in aluminum resistance
MSRNKECLGLLACGFGTNVGSRIYFLRLAFEGLYLWNKECLDLLACGHGTNVGSRIYFLRLAFEGLYLWNKECLGLLACGFFLEGNFRLFEWA